jgi:hypothetical protein
VAVDERVAEEVKRRAPGGRLPCAAAFEIAEKLGVAPIEVGRATDELGIKIIDCQLGCFGGGKKQALP